MAKKYRQGAVGALLDEYERAISDLKKAIESIPDETLARIADTNTTDEDCRSVQTILSHVLYSGYGYAVSIHNYQGHHVERPVKQFHDTVQQYLDDLDNLFLFTESIFNEIGNDELEQMDNSRKIKTGWGQVYDIEQLTEHAIVHILRHRRQIEKFKLFLLT
jgi:uncharacterized damage-inducible protein DinB